jgi:hypothetical protein
LRLPGFSLKVGSYIDVDHHTLRYVLKNKRTGDTYFVLLFIVSLDKNEEGEEQNQGPDEETEVD